MTAPSPNSINDDKKEMRYSWNYMALWMMTVAVMLGCSSESYPGIDYEPEIPDALRNDESGRSTGKGLPVSLSVSGPSFQITNVSRGQGPLDDVANVARFKDARFYVFAFRDNPDDQGPFAYNPSFKQHSKDDNPDCLIDDSDNEWLGMPARIDIESGAIHMLRKNLRVDSILYYGTRHQDIGYDFFVYHIDDVNIDATNAHRDETGIYYDLELDGTQDIMTGRSIRFTDEVLRNNYPGYSDLPLETRNHIMNIGNYSAYSANFDINPIIYMCHLLTKLEFYAYPADKSAMDIEFSNIEITARCQGRLYVVRKDMDGLSFVLDENAEPKQIPLMERSDEKQDPTGNYQPLTPERYKIDWENGMDTDNWLNNKEKRVHIGGDIMLPTADSFFMKVVYKQKVHADPDRYREVEANFVLKAPELEESLNPVTGLFSFLPSKSYTINIGVYGGRTPEVVVSLSGWEDGGELVFPSDPSEKEYD